MKSFIYFIYRNQEAAIRETASEKAEEDVAYWLGKSPGMYIDDIEEILVVEEQHKKDFKYVIEKMREQEEKDRQQRAADRELAEYERLKLKFQSK